MRMAFEFVSARLNVSPGRDNEQDKARKRSFGNMLSLSTLCSQPQRCIRKLGIPGEITIHGNF